MYVYIIPIQRRYSLFSDCIYIHTYIHDILYESSILSVWNGSDSSDSVATTAGKTPHSHHTQFFK